MTNLWSVRKALFLSVFVVSVLFLLAACAPSRTPTPVTPTPSPTPPAPAPLTEGKRLFNEKCAVCHGPNAEGTAAAPAIAGHSPGTLKTQVRNPVGAMPAFPPSVLSDHDLDEIAEFITSLGKPLTPVKEWEKAATETFHHWMALLALKSQDPDDARHHLQDVLTFIKDPRHKEELEEVLELIAQGKMHDAEHQIEEMAGGGSPSGITMQRFHLILSMRSLEAKDAAEAKHHLQHFMTKATEKEKGLAREALELVEEGHLHEAEHEVEELLKE